MISTPNIHLTSSFFMHLLLRIYLSTSHSSYPFLPPLNTLNFIPSKALIPDFSAFHLHYRPPTSYTSPPHLPSQPPCEPCNSKHKQLPYTPFASKTNLQSHSPSASLTHLPSTPFVRLRPALRPLTVIYRSTAPR